jgi:hypothetical protein
MSASSLGSAVEAGDQGLSFTSGVLSAFMHSLSALRGVFLKPAETVPLVTSSAMGLAAATKLPHDK